MIIYQPIASDDPLQDIAYEYDLAGNILAIHDRTPNCGTQTLPDRLDREFTYDPLYRLHEATGRECDSLPSAPPASPWNDSPCCEDVNRTRAYRETYEYDPVGNMESLTHNGGSTGYTRNFSIFQDSNRLNNMNINGNTYSYTYDDNGNLIQENTMRHFEWDHSGRMRSFSTQVEGSESSVHIHYLYDSQGNRVKKLIRNKGGPVEVTVYIDGVFEHCQRFDQDGTTSEDNTLHFMDDQKRIALLRAGRFPADNTPAVKYHIGDHLGSSNVVIDDTGAWVNREDYTPYGETSFGSFARKRYRFVGKEREKENGLYYYGARYYVPWVGRWINCDPAGAVDGPNLYLYVADNPIRLIDPAGMQGEPAQSPPPVDPKPEMSDKGSNPGINDNLSYKGNIGGTGAVSTFEGTGGIGNTRGAVSTFEGTGGIGNTRGTVSTFEGTGGIGNTRGTVSTFEGTGSAPGYPAPQMEADPSFSNLLVGSLLILLLGTIILEGLAAEGTIGTIAEGAFLSSSKANIAATLAAQQLISGNVGNIRYITDKVNLVKNAQAAAQELDPIVQRVIANPDLGLKAPFWQAAATNIRMVPAVFGKSVEVVASESQLFLKALNNAKYTGTPGRAEADFLFRLNNSKVIYKVDITTWNSLYEHFLRDYLQKNYIILIQPGPSVAWPF